MQFDRAYLTFTVGGVTTSRIWIVSLFATPETIMESAERYMPGMYVQDLGRTEYEFGYRDPGKKEVVWVAEMEQKN